MWPEYTRPVPAASILAANVSELAWWVTSGRTTTGNVSSLDGVEPSTYTQPVLSTAISDTLSPAELPRYPQESNIAISMIRDSRESWTATAKE